MGRRGFEPRLRSCELSWAVQLPYRPTYPIIRGISGRGKGRIGRCTRHLGPPFRPHKRTRFAGEVTKLHLCHLYHPVCILAAALDREVTFCYNAG